MSEVEYLDFEKEIEVFDLQIEELKKLSLQKGISYASDIRTQQAKRVTVIRRVYNNLTPWQIVRVSRHSSRPVFLDYLGLIFYDFRELHGDKCYGDDPSIVTGLAQIQQQRVLIVASNKGKNTAENIERNFGSSNPSGYKKALQKMKFAEKFNIPIVTIIDTPGAYPGIKAEEQGQAYAIAQCIKEMSGLKVPIISIIIGEGGSGGALAIGVADRLAMLEFAYYSVISPEGCAAILWRDGFYAPEAASALKLTSSELKKLKLIDDVIEEPLGGAHRNPRETAYYIKSYIVRTLKELNKIDRNDLVSQRYEKLRNIGSNN